MIITVKACENCPFFRVVEYEQCSVGTPNIRRIERESGVLRPSWCPIKRERVIVQEAT